MTRVKITTTTDEDKLKEIKKRNLEVSKILEEAIDGILSDNEPAYAEQIYNAVAQRDAIESSLCEAQSHRDRWAERCSNLSNKKRDIDLVIARLHYESQSATRSRRISQLLREINSAIVYNDYNSPDIELAVSSQIKEIKSLAPDFDLQKQIENIRFLNA